MGVERFAVDLLLAAKESGCPLDKVATLGRQNIYLTPSEIERFERDSGVKVEDLVVKNDDSGFADELFTRLGVQTLHTLDYSEYQGCHSVYSQFSTIYYALWISFC